MIDPELKKYLDQRFDEVEQRFGDLETRLRTTMMIQFEYLIREIHRIEDGRPRPAGERSTLPPRVGPGDPFPQARRANPKD